MHVDIDTPRSDLLNYSAIWSNSNTNFQVITQQLINRMIAATSSTQEYALTITTATSPISLDFVIINGDETLKPLCMIGIPSDGTINTISVQATTTNPVGRTKSSIKSGKVRFQLLKWLQRKKKRQQINGYSNRINNKE